MANITVTHTFVNGTPADATEVNTNFSDIIAGTSDGTKDFSISALTVAGTANFSGAVNLNGATTTLGNAITDSIVFTGRVASDIDPITTATYSFGSTSVTWKDLYLDNGATDGGAIFFNASASSFIKSDAAGTDLDISGFTNLDLNGLAITGAAGASFDGAVIINESGADVDFRVEGDTKTNLLFVDASTDNLGINTTGPTSQLHIKADVAGDVNSGFLFEAAGNTDKLCRIYQESAAIDTRGRFELYFADGLTHAFDAGANSYINNSFNFALGTASPGANKLAVATASTSDNVSFLHATSSSYTGTAQRVEIDTTASTAFNFMLGYTSGADLEFKLSGNGNGTCDGSWTGGGADYAEYFESLNGSTLEHGVCVVLDGAKVRVFDANIDTKDAIIGVVRPKNAACMVGNAAWNKWENKYIKNAFGGYELDDNGHRKLNPDYNPDLKYIPREDRPEWSLIGLLGQIEVKKGETVRPSWIFMGSKNESADLYLVR